MEKIYHIYARNNCIFHSLKEEEFKKVWGDIKALISTIKTEYSIEDISYEELTINKEEILSSSH